MRLKIYTAATTAEAMGSDRDNHIEAAIIVSPHRLSMSSGMWVTVADTARNFTGIGSRDLFDIQLDMACRLGGVITAAASALLAFVDVNFTPHVKNVPGQINPVSLGRLITPCTTDTKDTALRTKAAIWF